MRRKNLRLANGNTIVEFGPALYIVLLVITAPMIAFGSFAARYACLANAANLACQQASKARTFKTDIPGVTGSPAHNSAVTTAKTVASLAVTQYGGGYINLAPSSNGVGPVNVYIKVQPTNTSTPTPAQPGANTTLTGNLLNPTLYSYTCEVQVTGIIQPIFPGWSLIPGVPMLNQAMTLTTKADYAFENTLNLSI